MIVGRGDPQSGVILEGWFRQGDFGGVILSGVIVDPYLPERPKRYAELAKDLAIGIKVNNALLFECFLLLKFRYQ